MISSVFRGLTGYVDDIEGIRTFPFNISKKVFTFTLNNAANRRIKVLIWNENIERYAYMIQRFQVCRTLNIHSLFMIFSNIIFFTSIMLSFMFTIGKYPYGFTKSIINDFTFLFTDSPH